jgi:hypothetical protein
MTTKEKSIVFIFAALLTSVIVYITVRLGTGDAAYSVVPGWHTTIAPPEITWSALTVIILLTSGVVYLLFKGIMKFLTSLWVKFNRKQT